MNANVEVVAIVALVKVSMLTLVLMRSMTMYLKVDIKRVSGGVEYVAGLNEFHANLYQNLRGLMKRKYIGPSWAN